MKKLALVATAAFLFVACDNKPKSDVAVKDTTAVVADTAKKDTAKLDSAKKDTAKKIDSAKTAKAKK
jgi:PBP1b-binding outer membrane lipoprotein LpoB